MPLEWNIHWSTGIARIDHQHRQLVSVLDELVRTIDADSRTANVTSLLTVAKEYAGQHFECEEACMERLRCSKAQANQIAHRQFIRTFAEFERRIEAEGISDQIAIEVERYLSNWILEHLGSVDSALRDCLPPAGSSQQLRRETA